jgi:hypothetical protein
MDAHVVKKSPSSNEETSRVSAAMRLLLMAVSWLLTPHILGHKVNLELKIS